MEKQALRRCGGVRRHQARLAENAHPPRTCLPVMTGTFQPSHRTFRRLRGTLKRLKGTFRRLKGTLQRLPGTGQTLKRAARRLPGTGRPLKRTAQRPPGAGQPLPGTVQALQGALQTFQGAAQRLKCTRQRQPPATGKSRATSPRPPVAWECEAPAEPWVRHASNPARQEPRPPIGLVPEFHLGTRLSPKLRFAPAPRRRSATSRTRHSQAQLGNEGERACISAPVQRPPNPSFRRIRRKHKIPFVTMKTFHNRVTR